MAGAATPFSTAAAAAVFLLFVVDGVVAGRGQGRRPRDNEHDDVGRGTVFLKTLHAMHREIG